jgi:uncharacterized protein YodC (DUF2158 family)
MIQRFKIGDIVTLKTGSPSMMIVLDKMGVDIYGDHFFNGTYRCIWTDENGVKKTKVIQEYSLKLIYDRVAV